MPDIWAHIIFGEEVALNLGEGQKKLIEGYPQLFRFACQGPDFLFYYRFWPWHNSVGIYDIGMDLHAKIGGQIIHNGIVVLKELKEKKSTLFRSYPQTVDNSGDNYVETEEYQPLIVYLLGLICHYSLDVAAHPFIHYKTGIYRPEDPTSHKYYGNHKLYEQILDTILLKEKRNLCTDKERVADQIDLGERLPESVLTYYQQLVDKFFNRQMTAEELNISYRDMIKAWRVFHDPLGWKQKITKLVEWVSLKKIIYHHFFYTHNIDNSVDYLNRQFNVWSHPADPEEVYYSSFDQLWDRAKVWAGEWIEAMDNYLENKVTQSELIELIPNLSFSSGKEPGQEMEDKMRNFQPIVSLK